VNIFISFYTSNHRENYKLSLKKMSRTAWKRGEDLSHRSCRS